MKNASIASFNEIDYQYWKNWWESWPQQIEHIGGRNLRPPEYDYKQAVRELHKILKFAKLDLVLDVGCGTGETIKFIAPSVKSITGIERAEHMLGYAKTALEGISNVTLHQMDAIDITLPVESFDKVYSNAVIQYIHKDYLSKYIQDMLMVTKKGGKVLIGDVIPQNERFNDANVTQLPEEYWKEYWGEYKPKVIKSGYEDRYHVLLTKPL